jgi:hypothetical protein
MKARRSLAFDKLKQGQLGISTAGGTYFAEAAEFCLHHHGHAKPVLINIRGMLHDSIPLEWEAVDAQIASRTHGDAKRAAEDGAYGVAIVLATETTGIPSAMKVPQGTGFDYWLTSGDENNFFEARLEVSGLLKGSQAQIAQREKTKLQQTKRSDDTRLPAYVCIVEFGTPEARLVKRDAMEQG